ncbi:hypothetical protein LX32DRAFT_180941 [Colletotrichum zoysiae]|uniref:Uncharacterized protein n=1 Tax=Colletotrichum zoysiae TaxID=1216348 RepID=A0AAD9M378_9PEZI|nr:hypothetical protein LX32DRAFT_180941 [Colletotrichum zoysiae]
MASHIAWIDWPDKPCGAAPLTNSPDSHLEVTERFQKPTTESPAAKSSTDYISRDGVSRRVWETDGADGLPLAVSTLCVPASQTPFSVPRLLKHAGKQRDTDHGRGSLDSLTVSLHAPFQRSSTPSRSTSPCTTRGRGHWRFLAVSRRLRQDGKSSR